jgi:hypothetical protein
MTEMNRNSYVTGSYEKKPTDATVDMQTEYNQCIATSHNTPHSSFKEAIELFRKKQGEKGFSQRQINQWMTSYGVEYE